MVVVVMVVVLVAVAQAAEVKATTSAQTEAESSSTSIDRINNVYAVTPSPSRSRTWSTEARHGINKDKLKKDT